MTKRAGARIYRTASLRATFVARCLWTVTGGRKLHGSLTDEAVEDAIRRGSTACLPIGRSGYKDLKRNTLPAATLVCITKPVVFPCVKVIEGGIEAGDASLEYVIAPRLWPKVNWPHSLVRRSPERLVAPFDVRAIINEQTDLGKRLRELIVVSFTDPWSRTASVVGIQHRSSGK